MVLILAFQVQWFRYWAFKCNGSDTGLSSTMVLIQVVSMHNGSGTDLPTHNGSNTDFSMHNGSDTDHSMHNSSVVVSNT